MKMTFKNNIKFPDLNLQDDLKFIADRIFVPVMQENIHQQIALDEKPFPPLEPSTIAKKKGTILKNTFTKKGNIRAGVEKKIEAGGLSSFSPKTLIDTGKLVGSFTTKKVGKTAVVITLKGDRKDIGRYLQIEGVGKKRKKFNFFGISSRMEQAALDHIKTKIKAIFKNAK